MKAKIVEEMKEYDFRAMLNDVSKLNKEAERRGEPWRLIPSAYGVTKRSVKKYELWKVDNSYSKLLRTCRMMQRALIAAEVIGDSTVNP